MQTSVLLDALRELEPERIDLAGYPSPASPRASEMVSRADTFFADTVRWEQSWVPGGLLSGAARLVGALGRARLFDAYDVVLSAPGPFLASHDLRLNSALSDMLIAQRLGKPLVLSSHSIGPLPDYAVPYFDAIDLCVAREPYSHDYLSSVGISAVAAADYAFLYPFSEALVQQSVNPTPPYQLAFLRSNNYDLSKIRVDRGQLKCGDRVLAELSDVPLVLATSDGAKDDSALAKLSRRLKVPYKSCQSVAEMVGVIAQAASVMSDRYHPAVCAMALGRPLRLLNNRENTKMEGLRALNERQDFEGLQKLARNGLDAIRTHIASLAC